MDTLNIIFGVVGLISFGFSIYSHFHTRSMRIIEATKASIQQEKFRNIRLTLMGVMHSVDSIVQIPKKNSVSIEELQNVARNTRAQLMVLAKQLELSQKMLENWQYGKLFESNLEDV